MIIVTKIMFFGSTSVLLEVIIFGQVGGAGEEGGVDLPKDQTKNAMHDPLYHHPGGSAMLKLLTKLRALA